MAGNFLFLEDMETTPEFWDKYEGALRALFYEEEGSYGYYAGGTLCLRVGEDIAAASPRSVVNKGAPDEVKRLMGELYLHNKTPGHAYWTLALTLSKGELT